MKSTQARRLFDRYGPVSRPYARTFRPQIRGFARRKRIGHASLDIRLRVYVWRSPDRLWAPPPRQPTVPDTPPPPKKGD